ncbi:response regulator [Methanoregula sp.]|jgi:signal transduction histidine kinase/ActR/RegA family two-component response regulator|uniref:response regulator n=1 Tax=Methanoregula sp. TaxID=2052170 RepID=UPI003C7668BC
MPATANATTKNGRPFHILIVEDSRVQAEILKHILESKGYITAVAENGRNALDLISQKKPDLIISDVIMPVMNGYDLCKEIKKENSTRNIPIILLTALSDSKDVALALQAGADNFITKPYQSEYFLKRVKTILETPVDPVETFPETKPIKFSQSGKTYEIAMDRPKILEFLLSAYEAAVIQHLEFQRSQRELRSTIEKINNLNQIISISNSSLKSDALLEGILQKTLSLQGFEMGAIYLLNTDKTEAVMKCFQETIPAYSDLQVLIGTLNLNDQLHQELFIQGISQFIFLDEENPLDRDSMILKELGAKCYALLPLTSGSSVIGAITLISVNRHDFSSQEKSLLSSISTEIGNAVQKNLLLNRLEIANDETNLYLDIMTHDINNINTGALGYLDLLEDGLTGDRKQFAAMVIKSVNQSIEIIGNVSTIRKMHEQKAALKPVNLDEVIRNDILRFSNVAINFSGTEAVVLADDLLGQVFTNLIGNSIKFCDEKPEIAISVGEKGNKILVTVADNGPGIPDEMKPQIFDRFRKGKSKKSGKGLGLFITRHLIEGYGGTIWADDRVPGHQDLGAAIHFTLKLAN